MQAGREEDVFGRPAKKIFLEIDGPSGCTRRIFKRQCADPERFSCSFGIAGRNNGGMEVDKPPLIKKTVNGKRKGMPDAENCAKGIGAKTDMSVFS